MFDSQFWGTKPSRVGDPRTCPGGLATTFKLNPKEQNMFMILYDLLWSAGQPSQNVNIHLPDSSWFYPPGAHRLLMSLYQLHLQCLACPDVVGNPATRSWNKTSKTLCFSGETWWNMVKHPQKSQVLELTNWTCQVKGPTSSAEFLRCRAAAWFFCSWMGRWENCAEEPADPAKHRRVISVKLR